MSVLSLSEAKTHLNITATTYDAELVSIVVSAEAILSTPTRCGPLAPVTVTRRVVASGPVLVLPVMPVVSLTSVTPAGGTVLTLADLHLDTVTGLVTYTDGSVFAEGRYDVVFVAGRTVVPEDLLYGLKELVRHLWSTSQRGGSRRPGSEAQAINPATYLLPYQVQTAIVDHIQSPGVA